MLKVCLMGKFEVKMDETQVEIPSRPAQSLLAYLILNAKKSHRRESLAGLLWPDSGEANARNNLRQTLWRLRKSLGNEYLITDKISAGFNPSSDYRLDVDIFLSGGDENTALSDLIESVSVYENRLLPGFYDEWILLEQERLKILYEERMQLLLCRLMDQACWRETRNWAEHWIAQGAISEQPYCALMKAHAGLGDQAGMAAAFQRCSQALKKSVGIDPSPETKRLFRELTSGEMPLQPQKSRNYGEKSLPPVKLPLQPTPFVGRTDEIDLISGLLADPACRLISITGSGGMGKTRLAIESARRQSRAFSDGIYFVSLAPLDDPVFMVSLIAETVDFSFHVRDPREQWEADQQIAQLTDFVKNKEILLVIDNVEHLLTSSLPFMEEWKKGAETVVADILMGAPRIKILATTRERLNLQGETLVALNGLNYPKKPGTGEIQDIETYSAIRLFVKKAGQIRPGFALTPGNVSDVIDICRRVDGMPLAIQLAAAWVDLLSPKEIALEIQKSLAFLETSLNDIPVRQRSMRSIFESTWQRLTETEQDAFRQLSIFRGGFTRRAAQTITGAPLTVLRTLVNKSLLRPDTRGRYHTHELLRQFGLEQLARFPNTEAAAKDRHCIYFADLLKTLEAGLTGRSQGRDLAEIEVEIDNIRAAWKRAVIQLKFDQMEHLMESLCEFYRIRGELDEGFETFYPTAMALGWQGFSPSRTIPDSNRVFEETLQIIEAAADGSTAHDRKKAILGKVLARYARFHCESPSGEYKAFQIRHSALKILGESGEKREMAWVLRYMAHPGLNPREIQVLYKKALAVFKDAGDQRGIVDILFRLGITATQLGDYEKAEQLYRESLTGSRNLGRRQTIMFCLAELGWIQWSLGNYSPAEKLFRQSLPLSKEIGYPSYRATILRYLSQNALSRGDYQKAKHLLEESMAIYARLGLRGMRAEALAESARIAVAEKEYPRARRLAEESIGICKERTHQRGMVVPLTVLGEAALGLNDFAGAQSHFLTALKKAMNFWMPPFALDALAGAARLMAALDRKEPMFELALFVHQHPVAWQWSRDRVARLLNETLLSSDAVETVRARVKKQKLEGVVKDLCALKNQIKP